MQYIGETSQEIRRRFLQHRLDVMYNKKKTYLVRHFNEDLHCWADMRVSIMDKCEENEGKQELRQKELNWMKAITSVYPFGLNNAVKGYGNISDWTENKMMTRENCPYFRVPTETKGRRKHRGKKRRRSKITDDIFTETIKGMYNERKFRELYQMLRHASKKTLINALRETDGVTADEAMRVLICGYSIGHFDWKKKETPKREKKPEINVRIEFATTKIGEINVQSFMNKTRNKNVLGYNTNIAKEFKRPKLIYKYETPIGRKFYNYKRFLETLTDDELKNTENITCQCDEKYQKYIALDGHVITGDMNIIADNNELRSLMKKGTNYRVNRNCMTKQQLKKFEEETEAYAKKAYCKDTDETKAADVLQYTKNTINYIQRNIEIIDTTYTREKRYKSQTMDDLICTPIDKAGNNFGFVCKRLYVNMIKKEVQPDHNSTRLTYVPMNITKKDLLRRHEMMSRMFNVKIDPTNEQIPVLFGTPKLHKNPIKMRYIAGASRSTMKPLAITAHNMLLMMKEHFKRYCKTIETRTFEKRYISVSSSREVVNKIMTNGLEFNQIKTYDFSTLYTKLPHDKVLENMFYLLDLLFKNSGKRYVVVKNTQNKYGKSAFYSNDTTGFENRTILDLTGAKELIYTIITEAYIKLGTKIFKQVSGIPMGSNVSPLIADLVLSVMEYRYMEKNDVHIPIKSTICRYLDDILAVNVDISQMINNAYVQELEINEETGNDSRISYLDMQMSTEDHTITPYNKTNVFQFDVIRAYHATSCVPKSMIKGVIIGTLHRYCNTASHIGSFIQEITNYCRALMERGHHSTILLEGILMFVSRHNELLWKYKLYDKKEIKRKLIFPFIQILTNTSR